MTFENTVITKNIVLETVHEACFAECVVTGVLV